MPNGPSALFQSLRPVAAAPVTTNISRLALEFAHGLEFTIFSLAYLEPFLLLSQDLSFLHLHVVGTKVLNN